MDISTLIFGGLIGALIAIPFSYFINLTTPSVRLWLNKRSINIKGKSVEKIKKEYEITKKYKENPEALTLDLISSLGVSLIGGFLCLFFSMAFITYLLTFGRDIEYGKMQTIVILAFFILLFLILIFAGSEFFSISDMNRRIDQFEEYELSVLKRIAELENILQSKNARNGET